jgi:predicted nucleotidyltransferase
MDEAILFFSEKIKKKFPHILKNLFLFGSRARGDFHIGSDYDFLIVLKRKDKTIIRQIKEIEVEFLNHYDILSSCLIYKENEWEKRKKFPIGMNILKEGLKIL